MLGDRAALQLRTRAATTERIAIGSFLEGMAVTWIDVPSGGQRHAGLNIGDNREPGKDRDDITVWEEWTLPYFLPSGAPFSAL